jgi:hypothetical protein
MLIKLTTDETEGLERDGLERERSCTTFTDFFPNWVFSRVFLYILSIAPEGTANLKLVVRRTRSALFCVLISLKNGLVHWRARAAKTH